MAKPKTTYRQLKTELDELMLEIQRDDLDVDQAISLYQRGQQLVKELENYLLVAENTVKKLKPKLK